MEVVEPYGAATEAMAGDPGSQLYFTYEPLEHDQIRVLHLEPGEKNEPLVGELLTTDIENRTFAYDALSYMWGDPSPSATIWLSEKTLPTASNPTVALQHLRYPDKPLIIWVDAICIDQKNTVERNAQVSFMRHIYTDASTVRIWINEPGVDASSEAVAALQDFHLASGELDNGEARLGDDLAFWASVAPNFTNGYWKRAWV
jgi:hypothetical protein